MQEQKVKAKQVDRTTFYLRKLAKSGHARYLSVGTILPLDWEAVKVYVESQSAEDCLLRIIPIR